MNKKIIIKILAELVNIDSSFMDCIIQQFTTKLLCAKYDFNNQEYDDEYDESIERPLTNKKYPNFFQRIYHAGDISQFYQYIINLPNYEFVGRVSQFPVINNEITLSRTFHYIFDEFKKGIYVVIKNNTLRVFLPFSNVSYYNDWGQNLQTNDNSFDVVKLQEYNFRDYTKNHKYKLMIIKNINQWYANYYMFRNTMYENIKSEYASLDEGDKSTINFLEILTQLLQNRRIDDVCFFINPRDFPILKKNLDHPYDLLYPKVPNLKKKYPFHEGYIPIFSQSTTNEHADILFPNDDDINFVLKKQEKFQTVWEDKKPIAVFRGSATGPGVTTSTNVRLRLVELAKKNPSIIDAEVTGLNRKLKVNPTTKKVEIMEKPGRGRPPQKLTPYEQSGYKYIINVEGHVAAFRLGREFSYNSVILKVDSKWNVWFSGYIKGFTPGVDHDPTGCTYINVNSDLSNLVETIIWCQNNDVICKQIANNSYNFYITHLKTPDFMFDYIQKILNIPKINNVCKPHGLILIPFRDDITGARQKQLDMLLSTLNSYGLEYKVIVQNDNKKFNRGLLLNRGVLENQDRDYYIFHDVDLIPDTDLIEYYKVYPTTPIHLGYRGQRYSKLDGSMHFLGGVLSINKYDFQSVNGFPNNFWGWGGEDDALRNRLRIKNIEVTYPPKGSVKDLEELSIFEKMDVLKKSGSKNNIKHELLENDKNSWLFNGINKIKKDYLCIMCVGDNSLHKNWNFKGVDLAVIYFGDTNYIDNKTHGEFYFLKEKGTKFQLVRKMFEYLGNKLWEYDYVWIPDDDLLFEKGSVLDLFEVADVFKLDLCQPSFKDNGNIMNRYKHIFKNKLGVYVEYVNFVEVMCPLFSVRGLKKVYSTFFGKDVVSGWGLDFVWANMIKSNIAVIHSVVLVHTKPVNINTGFYKQFNIDPFSEMNSLFRKYHIRHDYQVKSYKKIMITEVI
jgi:hypothetical protein